MPISRMLAAVIVILFALNGCHDDDGSDGAGEAMAASDGTSSNHATPEEALADHYGARYLGPCEGLAATSTYDVGAICSVLREMDGDEIGAGVGPPYSEFIDIVLLRQPTDADGGWQIDDVYTPPSDMFEEDPDEPSWVQRFYSASAVSTP